MQTSTYSPGGPDRLSDDDLSAVKSEYGLHSYDTPPGDTPLSWMSRKEITSIAQHNTIFCFNYNGQPFAGILVVDSVRAFHIGYTYDDLMQEDAHIKDCNEPPRDDLFFVKDINRKSFLDGKLDAVTNLHTPNGHEKRLFLEASKIWLRTFTIDQHLSVTYVIGCTTNKRWLKKVEKDHNAGFRKDALTMIFIVTELRKISTSPSVLEPTNYETLIQQTEESMQTTNTVNQKQQEMKVVGHIDLDNVPSGTRPVTIDELNNLIANLSNERTSLEDRISNLRNMQAELETKFPFPRDPYKQVEHNEIKKPLSKRVKNLVHDYDFCDENFLAFRRGTYEGVLCLRNFNGEIGFWFAFNYDGDGKTVEFEEGKMGSIVENMVIRYANTAEHYLCTAIHEQMKHKIAAYKNVVITNHEEACAVVEQERKTRYDEYETTIMQLIDKMQSVTMQIENIQDRIKALQAEEERRKAAWKERDAKAKAAKSAGVSTPPSDSSAILQPDEAVRAYAESPYPSVHDDDYAGFIEHDSDIDITPFDQSAIETAAAESESYDVVIRSLQNLPFIHHLRGKRIAYGDTFPEIAEVKNYNTMIDEYAPFIAVAELTKLLAASRANTTHTCYITKAYLTKMAEYSQSVMAKRQSLLEIVPEGERFTGSFICPVDKDGGHHIYIFDIRRDDGTPRYRIAHLYNSELLGTCNYMYRGQFQKPYDMETYLPSEHVQVEVDDTNRWRKAQANIDEGIVRAFVSMELTSYGVVKHELSEGRGEESTTELNHGDYPNDIEIRDASWYTSVFVDKEIPVRGHTRRYWCGSGADRHLEVRTIMPHIRAGYHREAKMQKKN